MKKILVAAAVAMGAGLSSNVMAAAGDVQTFTGNTTVSNGTDDCPVISSSVKLGVSANVTGAYSCNEHTNTVKVGSCHAGGSRSSAAACAILDPDTNNDGVENDPTYNHSSCTANLIGSIPDDVAPDYNGYFVSSAGGTVAGAALGGRCSASSLSGVSSFW